MTYYEYLNRNVPDYYPSMYLDGYSPSQILSATRQKMIQAHYERQEAAEEEDYPTFHFTSEVRIK